MKRRIFTLLLLPLFSLNLYAGKPKPEFKQSKLKARATAACIALLTTTATAAVVVTKLTHQNPTAGWTTRNRYYRDRHALAIFLGKGLGRKFSDAETLSSEAQIQIVEAYESDLETQRFERVLTESDEEMLQRSLYVSVARPDGYKKGIVILPSLIAYFEITPFANGDREFNIRSIGDNALISRGIIRLSSQQPSLESTQP